MKNLDPRLGGFEIGFELLVQLEKVSAVPFQLHDSLLEDHPIGTKHSPQLLKPFHSLFLSLIQFLQDFGLERTHFASNLGHLPFGLRKLLIQLNYSPLP